MKSMHHSFDIHLAEQYGVHEAILIHHFQHWIEKNTLLKRNFHTGRFWTYQTIKEIAVVFPYWSVKQVERLLEKLVKLKVLRKGNFNKNRYDRTCWYSFENPQHFLKSGNEFREIGKPIPDTKTYEEEEGVPPHPNVHNSPPSPDELKELLRRKQSRKGSPIVDVEKWEEATLASIRKSNSSHSKTNKASHLDSLLQEAKAYPSRFWGEIIPEVDGKSTVMLTLNLPNGKQRYAYSSMTDSEFQEETRTWRR